jgi:serine/threonine-protein kinase PknG
MAKPSICREPDCGGQIVDDICRKCRAIYDDNPEAQEFAAREAGGIVGGGSVRVSRVLSGLSQRSQVPVDPTILADITPVPAGMTRDDDRPSLQSMRATLGGGLVTMPRVSSVDRRTQIDFTLRTPLGRRTCSNVKCVDEKGVPDAAGHFPRTKLYFPGPANMTKLPPNCRLESEEDEQTGQTVTYLVPDVGFCRKCSTRFNFLPIAAHTIIDDVRVEGPFAYGGDGFLYHATDTVLGSELVIKAPHNARNLNRERVASQESDALLALKGDPHVVQLLSIKEYEKNRLLFLERLDGCTLYDIRVANNGPLPIEVGLSYFIAAAAAVLAGHEKKPARLFLDVKPPNFLVLAPGDRLKSLDYGGSQIEGMGGQDVVWTDGFSAPELEPSQPGVKKRRPSKASDTWGLCRLLCFLSLNFSLTGKHRVSLPTPEEEPLFAEYESLHRFCRGCLATDPDQRMNLNEAIEQAYLLRNEIVALREKRAVPAVSSVFAPDATKEIELTYRSLPQLCIDPRDEAAKEVEAAVSTPDLKRQRTMLEKTLVDHPRSKEAKVRLTSLAIDIGDLSFARRALEQLARKDPFDCRIAYLLGRLALAENNVKEAARCFDACYSAWPAEMIKLACGHCAELMGDHAKASRYFETAAWVDPSYTAGPFGWARCAIKEQDWTTAIEAYDRVPPSSWAFKKAVVGKVQALAQIIKSAGKGVTGVGLVELQEAADSAAFVIAEGESVESYRLQADIFSTAIACLRAGILKADKAITILGVPLVKTRLRDAASTALINCSTLTPDRVTRIKIVDEANRLSRFRLL